VHLEDELSEAQAQTSALLEEGQRLEEEVNSLTLDREDALLSLSTEQEERATALEAAQEERARLEARVDERQGGAALLLHSACCYYTVDR